MITNKPSQFKPDYKALNQFKDHALIERAQGIGINVGLYLLLPDEKRLRSLKSDVEREEKRLRKEKDDD